MQAALHALRFDFRAKVHGAIVFNLYRGRWRLILFVNVLEVLGIAGVLSNILNVDRNVELNLARLSPVFIADLLDNGDFSIGLCACRVEPHVDLTIYFAGRPVLNLGARWNGVAVGNVVALAITPKLPAMKRALNGLAHDLSVNTQVRTQVWTKSIVHPCLA